MKDYKMTSMEQVEVALLVIGLLLHFMAWNRVTVNGETVFELTPFSFGAVFILVTTVIFAVAILSKFAGRFSGFSMVVFTHMAALAYLSNVAAKKMAGITDGIRDLGSAFGAVESTTHISSGGMWFWAAIVAFVLALLLLASWGVSAYRLSKYHRRELRNNYLWSLVAYLVMGVISVLIIAVFADQLKHSHLGGGGLDGIMARGYTMGVCGIVFFVMLLMFIVNASVLLLCEALRGKKRTLRIVAYVLAVLFFLFFMGVTSEKSKLGFSMPSSIDDLVMMAGELGAMWAAMTFAQLWTLVMSVACLMRGIYFSRHDETDDETAEEPADHRAVESVEEEGGETPSETAVAAEGTAEATTLFDDEEEANPYKKYYIGGGVAVAVLVAVFLLFRSCSGSTLLHGQKPSWDKFVTAVNPGVLLHKEADANSPVLKAAMENVESDMMDVFLSWEGDEEKRGYTYSHYTFAIGTVSPVLEEKDGWYKVQVNEYGATEAWVEKESCREVKPEPITPEVLEQIGLSGWSRYHLVKDGKLKNLVLHSELSELDGYSFQMGELIDGLLVSPEQHIVSILEQQQSDYELKADGDMYTLAFSEAQTTSDESMMLFFDPGKLTAEQIQQLYDAVVIEKPTHETAYYYFPEVSDTMLYGFHYQLTADNAATNLQQSASSDDNDPITDYRVTGSQNDWKLEAILGMKSEATGVTSNNASMTILDINDYDGDGSKECIIQEDGGGSAGPEPPYIVYYDSNARQYRKTEPMDNLGEAPEVITEDGQTSILFRQGIRWVRYVFENNTLRQTENDHKDMGEALMTVTTSMLFKEDEIGNKTVECDLDEDGIAEVLTFSHDNSHASNFGKDMLLTNITWGRDQSETSTDMSGERFVVLQSRDNFVKDILADYIFYRWNGRIYLPYQWNGDHFILIEDQNNPG